ncbi:MAG: tRNA preQ1(34) S-adenosylmethionine ribosyltransferase-isomerase QueA [Gemmatimonadetes bacterium]|nr:tRNA preQ1(34) S-adenosylmethionine ribosyltransferase-isomerase QueA [Gemmatimonadota bacterium]
MRTDLFDYELPRELIAAAPAERREESRLLVLHRGGGGRTEHRRFADIGDYMLPGDLLVVNDSRVLRARLRGVREATGGAVELLLLERMASPDMPDFRDSWSAMARPAKRMRVGEELSFGTSPDGLRARVIAEGEGGVRVVEFDTPDMMPWLDRLGEMPLPPYIEQRRKEMALAGERLDVNDAERYQTVYAREGGSVAAPTAGLHFTPELLASLKSRGLQMTSVTLHVGPGTFKPVETESVEDHPMHSERFSITPEAAEAVNAARREGRRVVAVGTTAVRTLESAAGTTDSGLIQPGSCDTRLLITPGYRFRVVDALITNFHLPCSTLLMLVSAMAGHEAVMEAYREAVREQYRFYSYGDAMLIV